jgi:hypothetical protein
MEISYGIICRRKRQKKPPLTSHHSSGVHPVWLATLRLRPSNELLFHNPIREDLPTIRQLTTSLNPASCAPSIQCGMGEQRWIFSTPIPFRNHSASIQDRELAAGPWCISKKLDTKRLNISGRWK